MKEKFSINPVIISHKWYCKFCGKEVFYEEGNNYFTCDCEGVQIESRIKALEKDLENFTRDVGNSILEEFRFQSESLELKKNTVNN